MNLSTAIFLLNEQVRCVSVAYDKVQSGGKSIPTEIKSFKTLDADLKKDDLVILPTETRWGYTVGKVVDVDLDVDFDSPQQMRWVVGKVDTAFVDGLHEQEQEVLGKIAAADKQAKRKELAAKLMANNPDGLNSIALVSMGPIHEKTTFDPEPKRGGAQGDAPPPFRDDVMAAPHPAPCYDPDILY